jgi:outer membrane protein
MKCKKYTFYLGLFLLGNMAGHAQRVLTLDESIATALQNNFDIQLSKNDSLVAAIDYSYRNAVFLPSLNATAGTSWNNSHQKQVLIDSTRTTGLNTHTSNAVASLNWVLFDGLKMFATRDKTLLILQQGSYTIQQQIVNTIAEVVTTYYNIARQEQLIKATDVQINLNEERAKLAQYKLNIGTGAKPDVLQSKVDLNEQKALKMQQETYVSQLKEQLTHAMNTKIQPDAFEIPDTIPVNYLVNLGDLQSGLEQVNPNLLLAKSNIDVANYTLKETKAGLFPTVSFVSNYNFSRTNNSVAITKMSPLFSQSNGFSYGFAANIPIFNQFNVKRQIRKNELNINYQKLAYESQWAQLNMAIINAYKTYEQQKTALKLEEENILLARENVDIVFKTYKLDMATLVQLRQAQLSLAQAYDRLIAARYNTKVSETELMRLRGDILK